VKLEGTVGIIGNGAGLVMSTLEPGRAGWSEGRELPRHRRWRQRGHNGDVTRGHPVRPSGEPRLINISEVSRAVTLWRKASWKPWYGSRRMCDRRPRTERTRVWAEILNEAAQSADRFRHAMLEGARKAAALANAGAAA